LLSRRPKLLIGLFTLLTLAVVAALQAFHTVDARQRAIENAQLRAGNLSRMMAGYVSDKFAIADTSLRQLVVHARRVGGPEAAGADWDPILAAAKAALATTGSISVVNRDGIIVHSTQAAILGQSRANDFIFKTLAATSRDELVVDRPFLTPVGPPRFLLPLGRRLTDARGRFAGAVVVTLLPENFREFFKTIDVGRTGIIWVFHTDGVVLFREPSASNPINAPATDNPLFRTAAQASGSGLVNGTLQDGGPVFISAFTRTATPPAIVAVSYGQAEVLANWRRQARSAVLAFGLLALTMTGMMIVLFRQIDARVSAERGLTEIQRNESQRLREANERLERALEGEQRARRETEQASYLKDQFLMTVSHELRTPLTAIYGWSRVLATASLPADQQRRAVEAVERNARAQVKLIDDLLDVARAISGKLQIDPRPLVLPEVLLAAADTLVPAMQARRITFATSFDPALGLVMADPDRLQQITWNLLSNAIKFTPEGGRVELGARRAGSNVEIAVSDTGAGIAPDFLPHVFERFRQQDAGTRRRFGGLGLGLAIVRHLAELHGGAVSAESAGLGQGATFRVTLPLRAAATEGAVRAARSRDDAPGANLRGLQMLIVDDEADARELFASILGSAGASAATAGSATEAREYLARNQVDVLLSDIEMPGEDGYALLEDLREGGAAGLPPVVIAVTAHAREVDRHRALAAGFHGHITKPIDPASLVETIAGHVRTRV
jgi:signal transduction histidine kinase